MIFFFRLFLAGAGLLIGPRIANAEIVYSVHTNYISLSASKEEALEAHNRIFSISPYAPLFIPYSCRHRLTVVRIAWPSLAGRVCICSACMHVLAVMLACAQSPEDLLMEIGRWGWCRRNFQSSLDNKSVAYQLGLRLYLIHATDDKVCAGTSCQILHIYSIGRETQMNKRPERGIPLGLVYFLGGF